MGFLDNLLGKAPSQTPSEELTASLASLDPALGRAWSAYLLNKARMGVLSREASEHYQMVKSHDRNNQTRAIEPYFREALALLENQRRLLVEMADLSKKRKFRMAKELGSCVQQIKHTEDTLRRIASATNDPAINRLQGMNDTLVHHRSMELSVLLPCLR